MEFFGRNSFGYSIRYILITIGLDSCRQSSKKYGKTQKRQDEPGSERDKR